MLIELEYGQAATLRGIELWDNDGAIYASALASGDVKIYKNGGAGANLGTLPSVSVGNTYDVVLTAAELQTTQAVIEFVDQPAGTAFASRTITIQTWGHPSAFDPQGVILAGTAQTTGTTAAVVRLANGQEPEAGQDIEFVAGPWLGRRVITSVEDMGASNYQATLDRAAPVSLDNTSRYRISGGSLPTSVEEFTADVATAASIAALDAKIDTLDTVADAVKVKTDSLTFTQAGHVDANIQRINDVAITGDGSGTPFNV